MRKINVLELNPKVMALSTINKHLGGIVHVCEVQGAKYLVVHSQRYKLEDGDVIELHGSEIWIASNGRKRVL